MDPKQGLSLDEVRRRSAEKKAWVREWFKQNPGAGTEAALAEVVAKFGSGIDKAALSKISYSVRQQAADAPTKKKRRRLPAADVMEVKAGPASTVPTAARALIEAMRAAGIHEMTVRVDGTMVTTRREEGRI